MKKYKIIPASDYCQKVFDGTHDTPKPCETGFKLLTSKNILNGELDKTDAYFISEEDYRAINQRSQVKQYDILFSMIGSVGNVCFVKDSQIDFAIKNMGVFSCEDKNKALFLYYYLQSPYAKKIIDSYLNGAVQKFLGLERLRNFPVPEYTDDKSKIASVLFSLDDKIALNRRINAKLEAMAKRLYDHWFVQFDFPFDFAQGKPNADGKPYKSSGGKMEYNEVLKREIPAGWEVGNLVENRLTEIIKPGIAKFLKKKNYLATANIVGSDITDGLWIEFENRESRANMQPIYNSVWFAKMKNSIKHLSITNSDTWVLDKYILSTGFLGLKCSRESFAYIHSFINYSSFEGIKDTLAHGATQQAVNNEDLKSIPLLIPSKNVLVSYSNIVLPMIQKMNGLQQMNAKLTALRDRLLPLLMNGQVEVE